MNNPQWAGKVVLITGGSSGLGLAMARAFANAGSRVAIVGRDAGRLAEALRSLRDTQADSESFVADVTQDDSVNDLIDKVQRQFGRLDVLINGVGQSTRGNVVTTSPAEFQRLFEVNFLSAVRCTQAALPALQQTSGSLVFIGSLASKTATKYLGAYPVSKFALAAYAQQLRLELSPKGTHVLLVCPGPIAREDSGQRYNLQAGNLPASAREPGGGLTLKQIDPRWLAKQVVQACERRQPELIVPGKARLLFAISQLFPTIGDWLLRRQTKESS